MVGGLTLAAQPSALAAAAPGFSVTPSTGLSDGSAVTVAITGAGAGEQFGVVQCATVNNTLACNQESAKMVTTDASGSVNSPFTVRKSFQGVSPEGTAVGAVNCATGKWPFTLCARSRARSHLPCPRGADQGVLGRAHGWPPGRGARPVRQRLSDR
ncbi:enediyne antibiotic chromoprotein [Nonomuraea sp. H19]|uniref:enediyne antibiotic chromoprotein n=1 Tax=Nonomuraea sp. H19 TaxID=3452206 RepID=UPI003F8BF6F9